jgi:hypothetical protein
VRNGARRVRFEIGAYDRSLPLVIDPVVSYGTYLGGAGSDGAFSVALDSAGNIYVAGITASPTSAAGFAPGRPFSGTTDGFVAKFNAQGTALVYATYLGGSDLDAAMAVAVDAQGNAYLTGGTNSRDFPVTSGAFQPRFGGTGGSSLPPFTGPVGDGFVAKLSPKGTLIYSSYLGGTSVDQGYGIAVDATGSAFVAGATSSPDFPVTPGVVQGVRHGYPDVFVARINPAGSSLLLQGSVAHPQWMEAQLAERNVAQPNRSMAARMGPPPPESCGMVHIGGHSSERPDQTEAHRYGVWLPGISPKD